MKETRQRYQPGALNWMRAFFFVPKNFSSISISWDRTGKREVSRAPTRYPEQYACSFVFRSKNFFDISIFGGRQVNGVSGTNAVP